jgi:hypothetical protein
MRIVAPMMILIMMTSTLAGCTGGDPDGGGNDEINMEILNSLIDDNLQDFVNNTTVEVTNNYYDSDNSTTINYVNGTSTMTSTLHTMVGTQQGMVSQTNYSGGDLVLLVRGDAYPEEDANSIWNGLNGANICVGIGTEKESQLVNTFSSGGISFTSVPVADVGEATAKFIDGSCDVLADDRSVMVATKGQIDGDGSMNGVSIWITNIVSPYQASGDYLNHIQLIIPQANGYSTFLNEIYVTITLSKSCINCSNNESDVEVSYLINDMSSMHQIFGTNYATEGMSTCEYSLDTSFSEEGLMFGPGLECEHHIIISVGSYALDANYEYIWSDWTYYVHWSTAPVVMH